VMELASLLTGESFTDSPASVSPVIAGFLRGYNDRLDDRRRQELIPFAARAPKARHAVLVRQLRGDPDRRVNLALASGHVAFPASPAVGACRRHSRPIIRISAGSTIRRRNGLIAAMYAAPNLPFGLTRTAIWPR
jgi:hypothetical protein